MRFKVPNWLDSASFYCTCDKSKYITWAIWSYLVIFFHVVGHVVYIVGLKEWVEIISRLDLNMNKMARGFGSKSFDTLWFHL